MVSLSVPRVPLGVAGKLTAAIGALVLTVLVIGGAGALMLHLTHSRGIRLDRESTRVERHTADLVTAATAVKSTTMQSLTAVDQKTIMTLGDRLERTEAPAFYAALNVLAPEVAGTPPQASLLVRVRTGFRQYRLIDRATPADVAGGQRTPATRAALAGRAAGLLDPVIRDAVQLRRSEQHRVEASRNSLAGAYAWTWGLLVTGMVAVLLLGVVVVSALIRDLVPRLRRYSQFARDVAAGRPVAALLPTGSDELSRLGAALDDMVRQRDEARQAEGEQRELVGRAEQEQAEFVDALQVTSSEDEAQEMLQRHLQRSLADGWATVLRSNNSAKRLLAATPVPATGGLGARLAGAEPRSCVAVRLGRTHREGAGRTQLLSCAVCPEQDRSSVCEPLLVGGEVIGAVLVTSREPIGAAESGLVRTTVGQAAPVLANLRSLALAEFRAANDSLTGLSNKRATEDTLKRMVAQASRSVTSLTAIMLDLDHFKDVNDRYGHAHGDEVLAAVGSAIQSGLRTSDFAGRFGGEEFLILLPETAVADGWHIAEKIRRVISTITVPGVDREITASLGVAGLLEHAGNATGLVREADRAQYAAKAAGRNRTVVATATATATAAVAATATDEPAGRAGSVPLPRAAPMEAVAGPVPG